MTYQKKKQLVILLNEYQNEILENDTKLRKGKDYYGWNGTKALLNHSRVIENKLSLEIEREMYGG